jgi:hypothetical protein
MGARRRPDQSDTRRLAQTVLDVVTLLLCVIITLFLVVEPHVPVVLIAIGLKGTPQCPTVAVQLHASASQVHEERGAAARPLVACEDLQYVAYLVLPLRVSSGPLPSLTSPFLLSQLTSLCLNSHQ